MLATKFELGILPPKDRLLGAKQVAPQALTQGAA
jgi:hypothetical protein